MKKILFVLVLGIMSAPLGAEIIDFETDGAGDPSGASITSGEYAAKGLTTIDDSEAPAGLSYLNDTHPDNVGTPISGKYLNTGAAAGVSTVVDMRFDAGIETIGFDWATGKGALLSIVSLFNIDDDLIAIFIEFADSTFVNAAGFEVPAGSFMYAGMGDPIHRVLIEDQPGAERAMIIDNVVYTPVVPEPVVPEPSSLSMILLGGWLMFRKGKNQQGSM